MSSTKRPLFLGGQCRIMCKASTQTLNTRSRVGEHAEETLGERVAVGAAFLLCVVLVIFMG